MNERAPRHRELGSLRPPSRLEQTHARSSWEGRVSRKPPFKKLALRLPEMGPGRVVNGRAKKKRKKKEQSECGLIT